MKSIILLLLLTLSAFFFLQNQPLVKLTSSSSDAFSLWRQQFGKSYANGDEEIYRKLVFEQNLYYIDTFNSNNDEGVILNLNQFADLTLQEFKQNNMGRNKNSKRQNLEYTLLETVADPPKQVDWRTKGAVTPMKNQGSCGSCWAFSAVGGLEGSQFLKTQQLVGLSEQQIVDCSHNGGNAGCNGGDLPPAFDYVLQFGIEKETDYPYRARDQRCAYDKTKVVYTPAGYKAVTPNSPDQLVSAVVQQPVPICIEADSSVFQFYSSGVLSSKSCGTDLDHCVTLVGYDDTATKPYWIIKNSWGTGWGQKGYIWIWKDMTPNTPGICGMYEEPVYPTN